MKHLLTESVLPKNLLTGSVVMKHLLTESVLPKNLLTGSVVMKHLLTESVLMNFFSKAVPGRSQSIGFFIDTR